MIVQPEHVKLGDHVILAVNDDVITLSSDVILKYEDCSQVLVDFLMRLRDGDTKTEVDRICAIEPECRDVYDTLTKLGFVVKDVVNPWQEEPFSANFSFFAGLGLDPSSAQQALLNSHVVILGLGGTGSVVLQHLVGAGVGRLSLVDPDIVEAKNLNRQFIYSLADVGRPKVDAAAAYVNDRLPSADVVLRRAKVTRLEHLVELELLEPVSFVLNAADHPACEVLEAVAMFCEQRRLPFLSGGCGFLDGNFGPLVTPETADAHLLQLQAATKKVAALGVVAEPIQRVSFGPLNTIVGAYMARDIIDYLVGRSPFSLDHYVWIDLRKSMILRRPSNRSAPR